MDLGISPFQHQFSGTLRQPSLLQGDPVQFFPLAESPQDFFAFPFNVQGKDLFQQHQNVPGSGGIQGAGRFVAKQEFRVLHQRSCDGAALLLAAGELGGEFVPVFGQPQHFHQFLDRQGLRAEVFAQLDVLPHRQIGHQVVKLENKAQIRPAVFGQGAAVQRGDFPAFHGDAPAIRPVQTADAVQQSGFSAAGRALDHAEFSPGGFEGNSFQHLVIAAALAIALKEVVDLQKTFIHGYSPCVCHR